MCIRDSTGATTLTRYWDMGQAPPVSPTISLDEAIEEGARLLTRATEDAMRGDWRIGVYLSGGLDSRAIAAMLAEQGCKLQTFTFGQPGCRDEHYARQIAAAIHAHHHYYPYPVSYTHLDVYKRQFQGGAEPAFAVAGARPLRS